MIRCLLFVLIVGFVDASTYSNGVTTDTIRAVRIIPNSSYSSLVPSDEIMADIGSDLSTFYYSSSGGSFDVHLSVDETTYVMESFSIDESDNCYINGVEVTSSSMLVYEEAFALAEDSANASTYDSVALFTPYCNLGYVGVAYVVGSRLHMNVAASSVNSTAYLMGVLAHEFGHNLGLLHAHAIDGEYGNEYDEMGSKAEPLLAQFSTYYKYFLGWIPEESILQMSHGLYCEADESCVSDDTTVWLYAHDTGEGFNSSLYYCILYRLEYPNTYMTLEFRSLYESDLPGVMMEWVTRRYEDIAGPSYLIDPTGLPRLVTDTTGAAFVPVNSTYVYDYREGGNAVAVTVLELDEDTQRVKVRVRHMNKSANDVDEFENELQNLASISCGDTVNYTEAVGRTLFHLETPNPSKVSLNVTCGDYLDAYIFGGKPFHLFSDRQGEFNLATFNSTSLYDWNRAFDVSGVEYCSADACNVALTVSPFLSYAGEMIFYAVPGVSSGPAGTVYVNDQYEVYLKSVYMGYYGIYYYCWVFCTSLACGSFYGLVGSTTLIYLSELTEDDIAFTYPITTSSSRSWTSACTSESRTADLQNAYAYPTRYFTENFEVHTFANDSNYLLITGGVDGATAEVVCDVIYCGSNMFMNESSGLCEPCGQGMMSEPNSTSCVVDCSYLMLESPYVSSTGVMKTTGKYVDLKDSWELYSNGGRDTSYLLYFLNTQGWVLGTGSVASAAYSYEVSASNYRHPVLGESGVESGYSLTCMCADFPYCGECDGLGDGAMVSPLDGTSCFVLYESIYVTSNENHSIAGNYNFTTMTDGYPVFSSANYTLTRDYSGEWSFVALVNSSTVATKSESISVFWPTNISSTTAWSTGYLSIAPQENSLVMQDIYSSTFFAITPAPTSSPTMPTPLPTSSPTVSPTAPTPAPTMRPTLGNPSSAPTISDDTSLSYLKELFEQIGSNHIYLGLTVGALSLLCFMVIYRFVYYNRSHQIATQYNFANQIDDFS